MVLGHESSGTVAAVGSSVRTLQPGDRVAMEPGTPCRRCMRCKDGKYNLCPEMAFAATPPYDGTLAKYYVLPEDFCYKLPAGMSLDEGALVEPLAVAVHITKQAGVRHGDNVVVFGAGPVGLLVCAVAQVFGAGKVIAVDIQKSRLEFARAFAGTATYVSQRVTAQENARNLIEQNDLGWGADVVIDASGAEPSVQTGIHVLKTGGTYVQGGMGKDDITFPIMAACTKELTVKGSFRYGSGDYKLAVELVAGRKVDVMKLVTSKVKFEDAEQAFVEAKAGKGIKILIGGSGEGESEDLDGVSAPLSNGVKDPQDGGVQDDEVKDTQDSVAIAAETKDLVPTQDTDAKAVQTDKAPAAQDTVMKPMSDSKDLKPTENTEVQTVASERVISPGEDSQVNNATASSGTPAAPNNLEKVAGSDESTAAQNISDKAAESNGVPVSTTQDDAQGMQSQQSQQQQQQPIEVKAAAKSQDAMTAASWYHRIESLGPAVKS